MSVIDVTIINYTGERFKKEVPEAKQALHAKFQIVQNMKKVCNRRFRAMTDSNMQNFTIGSQQLGLKISVLCVVHARFKR